MRKNLILHPQLVAASSIVALVFALHARGYGDVAISREPRAEPHSALLTTSLLSTRTVVPRRDPFVAAVDEAPPAPQASAPVSEGAAPAPSTQKLQLRAVVLGARRYALIADGTSSHIVTLGTALAGSVVTDISLRGIALANGARFVPEEVQR
jgi:hypothetical protein